MSEAPKTPNELLAELLATVTENTTTLISVQHQAAQTARATKDARVYVQKVVENTSPQKNAAAFTQSFDRSVDKLLEPIRDVIKKIHYETDLVSSVFRSESLGLENASEALKAAAKDFNDEKQQFANATEHLKRAVEDQEGLSAYLSARSMTLLLCGAILGGYVMFKQRPAADARLFGSNPAAYCKFAGGKISTDPDGSKYCWFSLPVDKN